MHTEQLGTGKGQSGKGWVTYNLWVSFSHKRVLDISYGDGINWLFWELRMTCGGSRPPGVFAISVLSIIYTTRTYHTDFSLDDSEACLEHQLGVTSRQLALGCDTQSTYCS